MIIMMGMMRTMMMMMELKLKLLAVRPATATDNGSDTNWLLVVGQNGTCSKAISNTRTG